jgi:phytoene/squalene synthetase
MKSLFDEVSIKCSTLTTKSYSTSFSLGILFLNARIRKPIYSIYGFVRFADEIVDSFEGFDKKYLLQKFREDTFTAIDQKISLNPILNSFQHVVNKYNIEHELIDTFLKSMEMDLEKTEYTKEKYDQYILGSAEVVGLMCLRVFTEGEHKQYAELKPSAMYLGSAFQKVNFLRDLNADYLTLGRTYFPNCTIDQFDEVSKEEIEKDIQSDFDKALEGIKNLPVSSKCGVYLAYIYYISLFNKIKRLPAEKVLDNRIRINNGYKFYLMLNSFFQHKLNLI